MVRRGKELLNRADAAQFLGNIKLILILCASGRKASLSRKGIICIRYLYLDSQFILLYIPIFIETNIAIIF